MILTATVNSTLKFRRFDNPTWTGKIIASNRVKLIHVLHLITTGVGILYSEQVVDEYNQTTNEYRINQKVSFELSPVCGNFGLVGLVDIGTVATITSGVTNVIGQTDSITVTSGTDILTDGICRIDNELCSYVYSGSVLTLTERGLYGTTPASHSASVAITFSESRQMAYPKFEFIVKDRLDN